MTNPNIEQAIDIPGTPPGQPEDGPNYLKFLSAMRNKLPRGPRGRTLSIAAPASFWYLKAFPIGKMADELDYIVYMTYDLHGKLSPKSERLAPAIESSTKDTILGQWDAGNEYSIEGCPAGNCLRSHGMSGVIISFACYILLF